MRLIFMGTPDFSVPALEALITTGHEVVAVYSQPPRPAGRGQGLKPSPVAVAATAAQIPVFTPTGLKTPEALEIFASFKADYAVVVAYGLLLPPAILASPLKGCLNIHASLLPRWRGAAPIQRAIMAGDTETGVAIMQMEAGLDTGPIALKAHTPITVDTTAQMLHDTLSALGSQLIVEALAQPSLNFVPQAREGITYARKIEKAESQINFQLSAQEVRQHIHGLSPYPGAWFRFGGERIKILSCEVVPLPLSSLPAGQLVDDDLTIACGTQAIRPLVLQREGRMSLPRDVFLRGLPMAAGSLLL